MGVDFYQFWGEDKKKSCYLKKCANFHEFRGEITKEKGSLLQNLQKNSFCLRMLGVITSILGVSGLKLHFSGTEPVSFFGGTILAWGAQAVIWGGTAPECPPWSRQFIEL